MKTKHCLGQKASDLFSYLSLLKIHALGRRKKNNFTPPGSGLLTFKGQKKSKEEGVKSYFFFLLTCP